MSDGEVRTPAAREHSRVFDRGVLLGLLDGDRGRRREILAEYLADAPRQLRRCAGALAAGDAERHAVSAHRSRGVRQRRRGSSAAAAYDVERRARR